MRKLMVSSLVIVSAIALAKPSHCDFLGSRISVPMTAQMWVKTNTAQVAINMTASLPDKDRVHLESALMQQLKALSAKANWRIVSLSQEMTSSGLLNVNATATARLAMNDLNGLNDQLKQFSKPGMSYRLAGTDFSPSFAERQRATMTLREDIYHQALAEVAVLDKAFPGQHYFVSNIDFTQKTPQPVANGPMVLARFNRSNGAASYNQKMTLGANVILAAKMTNDTKA